MIIPDTVTEISTSYSYTSSNSFKSIYIGAGLTSISNVPYGQYSAPNLEEITVSPDNTMYSSIDGILYNKDVTKLLQYPCSMTSDSLVIPDTVTEISSSFSSKSLNSITSLHIGKNYTNSLQFSSMPLEKITVSSGNTSYSAEDNILYKSDKTKIIRVGARTADNFEVGENISDIS